MEDGTGGVVLNSQTPVPQRSITLAEEIHLEPFSDEHPVRFDLSPQVGPPPQGSLKQSNLLNRVDWMELLENQHLLTQLEKKHLNMVGRKIELYPQRFGRVEYLKNSSLLLLSGYPDESSKKYSFCCVPNDVCPTGECRNHRFCPFCNYMVRQNAARAIVPGYYRSNWFFVTASWKGTMLFNQNEVFHHWEAIDKGMRRIVQKKLVGGSYWVEELAVLQMLPSTVNPHVHALVAADEWTDDVTAELSSTISNALVGLDGDALTPDIRVARVDSQKQLLDRLKYMFKPVDLVTPYCKAWNSTAADDRTLAAGLNRDSTDLVQGLFETFKDRSRMRSKGILHPNSPAYVGVPEARRGEYREMVDQIERSREETPEDEQ